MITRFEYLEALELVDSYHRQKEKTPPKDRVLIRDWILMHPFIHGRLKTALKNHSRGLHQQQGPKDHNGHSGYGEYLYMDEINSEMMKEWRNVGVKSYREFDKATRANESR